jgi:hypothetical protein
MYTLPPNVQADLDQAIADRDAAAQGVQDVAQATVALQSAQTNLDQVTAANASTQQTALASAHVVIQDLTDLLNASPPPPDGTTPPSSAAMASAAAAKK